MGLGPVPGQSLGLEQLHQPVVGHVGAVVGPDEGVPVGVAVADPAGVQLGQGGVQGLLGLGGQGVARGLGLLGQGGVVGQAVQSGPHEVIIPGLAGLLVVHLVLGGHAGVEGGGVVLAGIGVDDLVIGGVVVELHVGGGVLDAVHLHRGEGALEDAAVPHQQDHGGDHHHHAHQSVQGHGPAVGALLLAALLLPLGLALGLGFLGLAHGLFSPLVQSMRAPVGRGKNRPGDLPAAMSEPLY